MDCNPVLVTSRMPRSHYLHTRVSGAQVSDCEAVYIGCEDLFGDNVQQALKDAGVYTVTDNGGDSLLAPRGEYLHLMLFQKGTLVEDMLNHFEFFFNNTKGEVKVLIDVANMWDFVAPGDVIESLRKIEVYLLL